MAYGARLESVLGASPRGFESPILRHRTPGPVEVPGFLLPVVPLVFRAPFALVGLVLLCVALSCSSLGKVARHPHVLLNTQQFRT